MEIQLRIEKRFTIILGILIYLFSACGELKTEEKINFCERVN